MAYKRVHVSELKPSQSARRLDKRDGTGKFDNTYVIRGSAPSLRGGTAYIYTYIHGAAAGKPSLSWTVFENPIDEIVEVEV